MLRDRCIARRRRWRVGASLLGFGAALAFTPAAADTTTASVVRDAWYQAPLAADLEPLCEVPTGCNPAGAMYADGTMHVGNLNGGTTEFSVVVFDATVLPPFAELAGGTAVFPVLDGSEGSAAVDAAVLTACLVREPFDEVDGAPADQAPAYDCSVRAPVANDVANARLVVDLARFADAWQAGGAFGLALLPDSGDVGSWHVALAGREASDNAPRADLLWHSPASDDDPATSADSGDPAGAPADPVDEPASDGTADPGPAVLPPPQVSRPPAEPSPPEPVVAVPEGGSDSGTTGDAQPIVTASEPVPYPYKVTWLLPLLILVGASSLTRSLRQEVAVVPADASKGLRARLWLALWPDE